MVIQIYYQRQTVVSLGYHANKIVRDEFNL